MVTDYSKSSSSSLTSTLLLPESSGEEEEKLGIDEALSRYAGEFGPWQLRHSVLTSLAWTVDAFHSMVIIFADREPAWRCTGRSGQGCQPGPLENICGLDRGSWEWVGGQSASTVAQWGLVCGERFKVGLAQSAFFAGCMIGCGIFGHLSDTFLGRKGSLTILCIMNAIFGSLTAASPSYIVYAALRILTGLSTGAIGPCAFVLATEPIGPSKRAVASISFFYFFSGAIALLSVIAYFIHSWRMLYVAISIPTFLFLVLALPFISESPRWYLIRNNPRRAFEILRSIAEKNGRYIPENVSLVLDNGDSQQSNVPSATIVDVVQSPATRTRLALAVIINFLCSIVYYGLSLNVTNLSTNLYVSTAVNAISEMPAFLLTALFLDRFGRKPLAVGTMWLGGGFCIVGSLFGSEGFARTGCGMVGIFGMAASFNLLMVYGAELFPTEVRNSALGCVQQAVQMGAVGAPMVVVMGGRVAFAVFGVCGILCGILSFYLPETLNKPLYDTMAGLEDGEKRQREV